MDRREDALRLALSKNAEETKRWNHYKQENNIAVENLDRFNKYLSMDVMVPIGRKAYMPGQLIHTNEVLVGHYQGYFSKCSSHKAKEICNYRLNMATEQLNNLKMEADLWQNKLNKPYLEGVLPNVEEREIIEEYNEEQEKVWRQQHKLRVKQAKVREKANREQDNVNKTSADNEIRRTLEEAELMEELEHELENLEMGEMNDETLKKLLLGEIALPPEKLRVAHSHKNNESNGKNEEAKLPNSMQTEALQFPAILKKSALKECQIRTNNNNQPNQELVGSTIPDSDESDENGDIEELSREVRVIKEQAKLLTPIDQIVFYECQMKIMRQKLLALPLKTPNDIDQKVQLLNVIETLEELLETAEDSAEAEAEKELSTAEESNIEEGVLDEIVTPATGRSVESDTNHKAEIPPNRRISFALQNETLEFRRNETVSEMIPKPKRQYRDIITLAAPSAEINDNVIATSAINIDRQKAIVAKVEKNLEFVTERQSAKDFELVDQILESSTGNFYTLHINFQHSTLPAAVAPRKYESIGPDYVPNSPADLYHIYLQNMATQIREQNRETKQTIFTNAYRGEDKVKVPILKESERVGAYEDTRMQFCKPGGGAKPILRNKSAVEKEKHCAETRNEMSSNKNSREQKSKKSPIEKEECMSAYFKVMNEVVENPITKPEPLPNCKYINAHTPKKRLSRFKQSRIDTENT